MEEKKESKSLLPKNVYKILKSGLSDIPGFDIQITETKYDGHIIMYSKKVEKE